MRVRIAVTDPLPMFRDGVAEAMRDTGHGVEHPDDLLEWAAANPPRIIALTLLRPADWTLLADLHAASAAATLIAVIEGGAVARAVRALSSGAVGILPREADSNLVRSVLTAAAEGRSILPVDVVRAMVAPHQPGAPEEKPVEREIAWIRLLAEGSTVARLAETAGYSERMMFRLLREVYQRWGVANRTEAIVFARGNDWL